MQPSCVKVGQTRHHCLRVEPRGATLLDENFPSTTKYEPMNCSWNLKEHRGIGTTPRQANWL